MCEFLDINSIGVAMSASGSMPDRPSEETAYIKPVVFYRERFHLKFFLMGSKLPAVLIVVSVFFLWLVNKGLASSLAPTVTNTTPDTEHVEGGKFSEMLTAILQVIIDVFAGVFGAIADIFPVLNLHWLPWLQLAWWLFVVWAIARSWFRWFRSYAEVSTTGFTIYTPKSFWFALGNKGNRSVPSSMIFDAEEASSILDNTLFAKTVSCVNVFVMDTAGNDDAVTVEYARRGKDLIQAIKYIAQFNTPNIRPNRK